MHSLQALHVQARAVADSGLWRGPLSSMCWMSCTCYIMQMRRCIMRHCIFHNIYVRHLEIVAFKLIITLLSGASHLPLCFWLHEEHMAQAQGAQVHMHAYASSTDACIGKHPVHQSACFSIRASHSTACSVGGALCSSTWGSNKEHRHWVGGGGAGGTKPAFV